jgi:FG-GAP-like repeat/FG-GAP repeat
MPVNDPGPIANLSLDYTQQWAGGVAEVAGVTTDLLGNVYTIGAFQGKVDFDPSANGRDLTNVSTSSNAADMFIRKQDSNGNLLWVKQLSLNLSWPVGPFSFNLNGPVGQYSLPVVQNNADISVDGLGNVYAIGNFGLAKWDSSGNALWSNPVSDFTTGSFRQRQIQVDAASNVYVATMNGLAKYTSNGERIWNNTTGWNADVGVDAAGNVYSVGNFAGNVDFDPGNGIVSLNSENGSTYIRQLKSNGELGWVKQLSIRESSNNQSFSMVAGASGIYVSGFFLGTNDFDPGAGVANLSAANDQFLPEDAFISKLDFAGNFVWAKSFRPQSQRFAKNEMAIDATGNLYITGGFSGTVDFDPGSGVSNLTNPTTQFYVTTDTFISKLNADGNFVWAKQFTGNTNIATGISVDRQGNAFTVGNFYAGADFDPGAGTKVLSAGRYSDGFLSKLDSAGNFVFAQSYAGERFTNTVALDDRGNTYLAGSFAGSVDFGSGTTREERSSTGDNDALICKLDAAGNHLWTRTFGGVARDGIDKVTADGSGNVYALGSFIGTVDFDPGVGVTNLTGVSSVSGVGSPFLIKFDAIGNFVWVKPFVWGKPVVLPLTDSIVDLRATADGVIELFGSERYLKFDRDGNLIQQEDRATVPAEYKVFDRQGNSYTYTAGNLTKRMRNGVMVWTERVAEQFDLRPAINADGDIAVVKYGFLGQSLRKFSQPKPPTEIFWRNPQTAEPVIWNLRNGTELVDARYLTYGSGIGDARAGQIVRYDATWRVAANVDMNGDRVRDFVYTRDGEIRVLTVGQLNGQTATVEADREYKFSAKFGSLSGQAARPFAGWELVGVEDMSGDGQRDFVFYSRQFDRTVIWMTDTAGTIVEGAVVTSAARPGGQETGAPYAWNVQAIGDFTGDGKVDMVWRNDQDLVVLWELDGTVLRTGPGSKTQLLPSIGSSFKVRGVGDFNGDGVQDILWRDQSGNVNRIWTFGTDGKRTEVSLLSATNSQWEIGGVADLNGDGTTDLIWRNNQENNVVVWNIRDAALFGPGSGYVLNYFPGGNQQVINPIGRSSRHIARIANIAGRSIAIRRHRSWRSFPDTCPLRPNLPPCRNNHKVPPVARAIRWRRPLRCARTAGIAGVRRG